MYEFVFRIIQSTEFQTTLFIVVSRDVEDGKRSWSSEIFEIGNISKKSKEIFEIKGFTMAVVRFSEIN